MAADLTPLPPPHEVALEATQLALSDLALTLCTSPHRQDQRLCARTAELMMQALADNQLSLDLSAQQGAGLPAADEWAATLENCGLARREPVRGAAQAAPAGRGEDDWDYLFSIWPNNRLVLRGMSQKLHDIAGKLRELATADCNPSLLAARSTELLDRHFAPQRYSLSQRMAAATALCSRLTLITGGPGTGKTHTAVALAAMMSECLAAPEAVALAAFTGRAAMRLATLDNSGDGELHPVRAALAERCFTLHRLLALGSGGFVAKRSDSPATPRLLNGVQAVIVDEASMVDAEILHRLLTNLPEDCHLVLVGDADQLTPTGLGSPFMELCAHSTPPVDLAAPLRQLGLPEAAGQSTQPKVLSRLARLQERHRYSDDSQLAKLADLTLHDPAAALQMLNACIDADAGAEVRWLPLHPDSDRATTLAQMAAPWLREPLPTDPEEAVAHLSQMRVLSAKRRGPWGVQQLSRDFATLLAQAKRTRPNPSGLPIQTPVLIERNDPSSNLNNGEMGVVLQSEDHSAAGAQAFFRGAEGLRALPLWLLPQYSTGWAITVHKSQGSEFDRIAVVLPEGAEQMHARALLYTAITRARKQLLLVAAEETIAAMLSTEADMDGALTELLRAD